MQVFVLPGFSSHASDGRHTPKPACIFLALENREAIMFHSLCTIKHKERFSIRGNCLHTGTAGPSTKAALLAPVLASASASVITGTALVATRYVVVQADGLTVAALRYV